MRIAVFTDRPDCLLIVAADDDTSVTLPSLAPPFTKENVVKAVGNAARVFEATAGRYTQTMHRAKLAERSERRQQQKQMESTHAAIMLGSVSETVRSRAEAMRVKNEVDEEIAKLKVQIGAAKSKAFERGIYMNASDFRKKEDRLRRLQSESQALQTRLGELRKQEKQQNIRSQQGELEAFRRAAKQVLPWETFMQIAKRAEVVELEEAGE